MVSITGLFKNNLRNVSEVTSVTLPAELEPKNLRMGTDPQYALTGETYQALVIPKNTIMKKFYLIVPAGMTGTATVTLSNATTTLFSAVDISTADVVFVSAEVDLFTDTQEGFDITLSADQIAAANGKIQVVCDFAAIDTNNGIYGG